MGQLIKWEFQKLITKKMVIVGFIIVVLFNLLIMNTFIKGSYVVTNEGVELKGYQSIQYGREMMEKYEGELTDEKVQQILEDYPKEDDGSLNGEFYAEPFLNIGWRFTNEDDSWNGMTVAECFPQYQKSAPLMKYDYSWQKGSFCIAQLMILVGFVVVITISSAFSDEYSRGTDALVLTSKYGKSKVAKAKMIAAYLFTLMAVIAFCVWYFVYMNINFGLEGWDSAVQVHYTNRLYDVPYECNYLQLFIYQISMLIAGMITLTSVTLLVSSICQSAFVSVVISAALYAIPMFIPQESEMVGRILALTPIRSIYFYMAMRLDKLPIGGGIVIAWFIVVFMLVVVALIWPVVQRLFAHHQVV